MNFFEKTSLRHSCYRRIWFVGGGEFARVLFCYLQDIQTAQDTHIPVAGFIDNNLALCPARALAPLGEMGRGLTILTMNDFSPSEGDVFILAVTRPENKMALVAPLRSKNVKFFTLVHPLAHIQAGVHMGEGCVVLPWTCVHTGSSLGDYCTLLSRVNCGHDVTMGSYSTLFANSTVLGNVVLGSSVYIFTSAIVLPNLTIGNAATIGVASVVSKDVPNHATTMGNPARIFLNS